MSGKSVGEVLAECTPQLMSLPGVVGTAEGERAGAPCIRVLVAERTPELEGRIGSDIEGYPIEIVETGPLRACDTD